MIGWLSSRRLTYCILRLSPFDRKSSGILESVYTTK